MTIENKVKVRLADGREVWRVTYVRYRDAISGKFISKDELGDEPEIWLGKGGKPDLEGIEKQIISTLTEIAAVPELAARSSASVRMLLGLVEKLKRDAEKSDQGEWFILGRELAGEVLEILEGEQISS